MTAQRWLWLGLWSLILPVSLYFLLAFFVGLDMLDLSSTTGNMILVVAAGVLAGLFVGFGFGLRDWRILIPPLAAGLIGLGLYPLLETVWTAENETPAYVMVWLAQSVVLIVPIWLSLRRRANGPSEPGSNQESARSHLA